MRIHKILAALVALVMVFSIVPASALAAGGNPNTGSDDNLILTKDAVLEDDGSYSIHMEAYATGTTKIETETEKVPLDIVLVLDTSGSMDWGMAGKNSKVTTKNPKRITALKKAAKRFVQSVADNANDPENPVDHRIGIVSFASEAYVYGARSSQKKQHSEKNNYGGYLMSAKDNQKRLDDIIDGLQANGATYTDLGVSAATKLFADNPASAETKKVMIVFTDGAIGTSGYEADRAKACLNKGQEAKDAGVTVYTIGLFSETPERDVDQFMSGLSSNIIVQLEGQPVESKTYLINRGTEEQPRWFEVNYGTTNAVSRFTTNKDFKNKPEATPYTGWYFTDFYEYQERVSGIIWDRWEYVREEFNFRVTNGTPVNTDLTNGVYPFYENCGNYYMMASNAEELDAIFESVSHDITTPTTSVTLDAKSILRDILAEGFELTAASTVKVSAVPGTETGTADASNIVWGSAEPVLTLAHIDHANEATGSYGGMKLKASVHLVNPEEGKKNLHTVDVTGFDYKNQYIAEGHPGTKLVVDVTGVKALPGVATDVNVETNHPQSGIWAPAAADGDRVLNVAMPQHPATRMTAQNYVVDYAKQLELPIDQFDMTTAKNVDRNGYEPFAAPNTGIDHQYGKVALDGNTLTYTPTTMQWGGYDTFYVFGTTESDTVKAASANANGNLWSKVNVIPANNVYYEDSFVTDTSNGTVGIVYDGKWDVVNEGAQPNTNPGAVEGQNDNHGWTLVLRDETGDTDGSSHHASGKDNTAKATFTFTGTGVDVYSRTSGSTGTISAKLKDASGKTVSRQIIDTKSDSGKYYQIPTLSFQNLVNGTYTVELKVTNGAENEGRLDYYLDGIRVYNPIAVEDETVQDAYGPDELNAAFVEVRDMLLDSSNAPAGTETLNGFVFIDELPGGASGTTAAIGTYKEYGPKNEVYLNPGQSIAFKVNEQPGNQYQIGIKSPAGEPAAVELTGAAGKTSRAIPQTADLYYDVVPSNGIITVKNVGSALVSITKLKVTNANGPVDTASVFAAVPADELLNAVQLFAAAPVAPEVTPEPTPEVTPEPTPEVEPEPTPDVEIEIPEVPEKPAKPTIGSILDKIFGGFRGWF